MKAGVLIQPKLRYGKTRIVYETNPYKLAEGVSRAMQRYSVIALTVKGSDSLRPWFGTALPDIPKMNVSDKKQLEILVRDQLKDAIDQFFILQQLEIETMQDEDIMDSIAIGEVTVTDSNGVHAQVIFYPRSGEAVDIALEV
jgi:hypothetical protein